MLYLVPVGPFFKEDIQVPAAAFAAPVRFCNQSDCSKFHLQIFELERVSVLAVFVDVQHGKPGFIAKLQAIDFSLLAVDGVQDRFIRQKKVLAYRRPVSATYWAQYRLYAVRI